MSQFAEKIKRHYAGLALGKVEVPEWEVTIHVRPATIGQSATILKEVDQFRQACRLIQIRAKKEDGSPLFDESDFEAMVSHGEVSVINRIVEQIVDLGDLEEGEAKKPSRS
jgi:hypothetical protein